LELVTIGDFFLTDEKFDIYKHIPIEIKALDSKRKYMEFKDMHYNKLNEI